MENTSNRNDLGHVLNDGIQYEIIGKRHNGSFRKALRDYGFDKKQIDRVIADLDCDRDVIIVGHGGHRNHLRAL